MNYEPKEGYYGQFSTDAIIELYFIGQEQGTCIEVGAANGSRGSNSLYFEKRGWRTLCIEPNPIYFQMVKNIRKEALQYACGDESNPAAPFTVYDIGRNNIMSSVSGLKPDERLVKEHYDKALINDSYQIMVEVKTLDAILMEANFNRDIDFISIDTEGTELDVLKGLDFTHWNISLLVVENNYNDKEIEEYLNKFGFVKDTRWKINDFYVKEEK